MPPSLPTVLQYASAASAIVSAGLWFWSAVLRMPPVHREALGEWSAGPIDAT